MLLWFLRVFVSFALWFRYRIRVKGLKELNKENLKRPGGILFLPNHPAMGVDPLSVVKSIWARFPVRPLIIEYMYYAPLVHSVMKRVNAIPVPNNEVSSNSIKRRRSEKALEEVVAGLKRGENFLLYPSGRLKDTGYEFVGGASGAHKVISENPDINIVLVRSVGFWGSSFSKAYTGKSPPFFPTIKRGIFKSLKNLIFFNPRRDIELEFKVAPEDFPRNGNRMEINRYLEEWYNRPEGLRDPKSDVIGEPLKQVSYSIWGKDILEPMPPEEEELDPEINLDKIPAEIKDKIRNKFAEIAEVPPEKIKDTMVISRDLGLDSLDLAELVLFIEEEFNVRGVPVVELSSIARTYAIASGQIVVADEEAPTHDLSAWSTPIPKKVIDLAEGKTIPEVFLNNAKAHFKQVACGDDRSGVLKYDRVLLGAILLSKHIRKMPGNHIGIMLPASVGATLAVLATQLAGKVPVMINWTVGPRHLQSVMEAAEIQTVLSSWAFIDRLNNVDLTCIDDQLVMLEDLRREITLPQKLSALFLSKKSPKTILKKLHLDQIDENDPAVVLFTSGTEAAPKGVPLSHKNLISNVRSVFKTVDIYSDDVFFSVLPPFHSFGLTAGIFLELLSGMRVAYYPIPTNGLGMANGVEKWKATIVCGAPSFLKGMLKMAESSQLQSLRWVVSGAEKAPPELYELIKRHGLPDIFKEGYGITECSPVLTLNRPGVNPVGVGQPVEGVEILVVHPETEEVMGVNEEGLVLVHGPNIFNGYLDKSLKSPFKHLQGKRWYNTGDLGFLDAKGRLTISGRLKRFIKVGGEMISLAAIENALLQMAPKYGWKLEEEGPSIAVCAKESPEGRTPIHVFTRFETTPAELNKALREAGFSNLVKISETKLLDEIPLMGTGKIAYRAIEAAHLV